MISFVFLYLKFVIFRYYQLNIHASFNVYIELDLEHVYNYKYLLSIYLYSALFKLI